MKINNSEIMDLTKIANTFPELGDTCVSRENMFMTLVDMLQAEAEVVLVEGPDGIGKTTLLAQFAEEHPNNTFGLFVRSSSRWAYDSEMITRELSEMIGWTLDKENFKEFENKLDPSQLLRTRIFNLQQYANKTNQTFYFVVDGLDEIPEEDAQEREAILDLLPFGLPRFRFILSGTNACLNGRTQKIGDIKSFRLPGFTFEETTQFMTDLVDDRDAIRTIHKISKHVPGNIASVRRLLLAGADIHQLIENLPEELPDLFKLEWQVVDKNDGLLCKALSILSIDRRSHSLKTLSELCKTDPDTLTKKLTGCSFLDLTKDESRIEFICDTFKQFALKRLHTLQSNTYEIIISDLLVNPHSIDSLTHLPDFLKKAERYEDILDYLTPEHIGRLIDCGDSWVPLHQKADLGVDTSLHLSRDGDLLRFGLQRAMIASMESAEPWRSELEAYIALGDFTTPYALMQQMATREDRLHLLAVIARAKKTRSLPIEVELSDQIQQLYKTLDHSSLGERGTEIASDLLCTHPELAVELVQKCTNTGSTDDRLDLALAQLSLRAFTDENNELETTRKTLRDSVKNPKIQHVLDRIAIFFGGFSAEGVIKEVEKWEKASDQIFALRAWAMNNAEQQDAASVIEFALSTILKTTTYTASAKVYLELISPLVYISNFEQVKAIICRLDGLRGTIESIGPTVEYVKLQAKMAEAESRYDKSASFNRLQDLFIYAEDLTETNTKLSSFAVISSVLKKIDQMRKFDAIGPIHEMVLEELRAVVDDILTKTASHYEAVYPAIGALAQSDTETALQVVLKLNTAERRERGLVKFIEEVASEPPSAEMFSAIEKAYTNLAIVTMKSKAVNLIFRELLVSKENLGPFINKVIQIHQWLEDIPDAEDKCYVICMILEIFYQHKELINQSLIDSLQKMLVETWKTVDLEWVKVDVGFNIVSKLAKCSSEFSHELLAKTITARDDIILDSQDIALSYICCVKLTIRCFSGLIKRKAFFQDDFINLQKLIEKIPSIGVRLTTWAELALKIYIANDHDNFLKIVSERIRPFLDKTTIQDESARWQVIISVAPALYCAHTASAKKTLDLLPQPYREIAYNDICSVLITKRLPFESYEPTSKSTNEVTYEDVLNIFDILECLEEEPSIEGQVSSLVENIQKRFRNRFNNSQIADVFHRLHDITSTKFANLNYIKHEGYKVLTEAQIASLKRSNNNVWDDLITRAKIIPNIADKIYVMIGIAEVLPKKDQDKAISLLEDAKNIVPQISFFEDRVQRYEHLAKVSADIDRSFSKGCLRQAWLETIPLNQEDLPSARRRIIDFAHRLDPEFAGSLAAESDNDPGREFARQQTDKRLEVLKIREQVADGQKNSLTTTQDNKQKVEVAQMMLSSLNSNRVRTHHLDYTRQFIKQASQMNLQHAHVMLSWVVENAVCRFSNTDQAKTTLRSLYQAASLSAELAFKIAQRIRSVSDIGVSVARDTTSATNNLIQPGEKEKAFSIITEWASTATGFIKITDPYFGLDDLEYVNLIRGVNHNIPIYILTSRKHQTKEQQPWDEAYQTHWRMNVSDCDPGDVTITVVGKASNGEHPIHDRWWLTEKNGLRFGTSANSLGLVKLSELSHLESNDSTTKAVEVDRFLERESFLGTERLRYLTFML